MRLEKVALFSSFALLGGVIIREVFKTKVRLRTMAVSRSTLQSFLTDEKFVALHFNPYYDNKTLAKDIVSLEAYQETTDKSKKNMQKVWLEDAGKEESYGNEKNYSAYSLTKHNIGTILGCFDKPEVVYVLFVPKPYRDDQNYFSYRIVSADANKSPLSTALRISLQRSVVATSVAEGFNEEENTGPSAFAMVSTSTRELYMDPSPPATMSFSDLQAV